MSIRSDAVDELIARIERYGERIDSDLDMVNDCRDPKDNDVLALALVGNADFILSEDEDLLVLSPWRSIRITGLFEFLQDHPLGHD